MSHKAVLAIIFLTISAYTLYKIIKNKPEYLLLLGVRGLFSIFFLHFINYICTANQIAPVVSANPASLCVGAFLGIPGIVFLYASGIYLA
ncbi:MAG: pro-sigmaK processing inhibitor BofA family protein [Lachnospiraceae bacterium]|nr:pro-sigmaK processing inhibitor BofA family protein [Lachnospiraceae bacterium]